jgi:hypothetical protein
MPVSPIDGSVRQALPQKSERPSVLAGKDRLFGRIEGSDRQLALHQRPAPRSQAEKGLPVWIQQRMVALALSLRAVRVRSSLPAEVEAGVKECPAAWRE